MIYYTVSSPSSAFVISSIYNLSDFKFSSIFWYFGSRIGNFDNDFLELDFRILVSLIGLDLLVVGLFLSLRKEISFMLSVLFKKKDTDCWGTLIEEKLVFGLSDSDLI